MKTNELLRRYVNDRSEAAFEELVRRHLDLVYSAALRQVNGDMAAAQDVTQAVFTTLARKAPGLTRHASLAGWLYTSTRFLAAKARRAEQRRRSHEQEAHEMNQLLQSAHPDTIWQDLRPLLDDAMHELSSTDREAVLMRYFERLPLAEIGARLGLKENAAHMRIGRAVDRLRAVLAKRGVTSTTTALAAVLAGHAVGAAPAGMAAKVSRAAFRTVAATGGLTWGLLKLAGLMPGKLLVVAGGAVLVAGLVFVPHWLSHREATSATGSAGASRGQAVGPATPSGPAAAAAAGSEIATKAPASNGLVLHIVAEDTGKLIPGATVEFITAKRMTEKTVGLWVGEEYAPAGGIVPTKVTADERGVCELPFSRNDTGLLAIRSRNDGFVDAVYSWNPYRGEKIPRQYTMRLCRSDSIGGQVVDEDGKPVAGAQVAAQGTGNIDPADNQPPPHIVTVLFFSEKAVTDVNGRWRIDRFARTNLATLALHVNHPDYAAGTGGSSTETDRQLLAGTYVLKLDRGVAVSGIVVDEQGQPVSGARVELYSGTRDRQTTNQSDGTFTLAGCQIGSGQINAEAPGFALATVNVEITNRQAPFRLELQRGNLLRLRVVDTSGMAITNATARLDYNPAQISPGSGSVIHVAADQIRRQTDSNGRISWDSAPEGTLSFSIYACRYQDATSIPLTADGTEHQITLHAARTISGTVRDEVTGQGTSLFEMLTGTETVLLPNITNLFWGRSQTFHGGSFRFLDNSQSAVERFMIKADGYAPFITRWVGTNEADVAFDITLSPASATTITITVLLPDGRPATHASMGLEMPGVDLILIPGGFSRTRSTDANVFLTDDVGQFNLPPDNTVTRVIAATPEGYAEATPTALASNSTMRLQPGGRIEGTFLSGGKPAVGRMLTLGRATSARSTTAYGFDAETDADGHFVFTNVPPGQIRLIQQTLLNVPAVTVCPGETTVVSVAFYTVTARLSLPAGVDVATNWNVIAMASQPQLAGGHRVFAAFKETSDGTWVAEDLPAGDYTLFANNGDSAPAGKSRVQAMVSFTVPSDPPSGTLDLGEIVLKPVH